jgi:phosphoglycerate dehydrogenase-like enzyme
MAEQLIIWCNADLPQSAIDELNRGIGSATLLLSSKRTGNLGVTDPDPLLADADIAFGQPNPDQIITLPRLRWIHLTSAGYTRYDRPEIRAAIGARGAALTTSSSVYAEPCAEHVLAMMLALARCIPESRDNQRGPRAWPAGPLRARSQLLLGQTALIVGYGAIGQRLAQLLKPLDMRVLAIRRTPRGDEPVRCCPAAQLDQLLPEADHIINTLPASTETERLFNAARFDLMKPSAIFYNIGRGNTVDQDALRVALEKGPIRAAYLDVMTPEPLPPDHPLWTAPDCHITPHTGGGHSTEFLRLVRHFLGNLERLLSSKSLIDQVI